MKKFKHIFPSRNYITVDSFGDVEIIFNPIKDGFEGDDKLSFRKGRWAFRVNDFLSGKVLPNGQQEPLNRKIYSLGIVWDSEDKEPLISTTYVDPSSVIPLDGSLVQISNTDLAKESTLISASGHLSAINTALTTLFDVPLSTRASEATLKQIQENINTKLAKESTLISASGHLSAINTALTTLFDVPLSTRASEATLKQIQENINTKVVSNSELLRINRLLLNASKIYDVLIANIENGKYFRADFNGTIKGGHTWSPFGFEVLLHRENQTFFGNVIKVFLFQPHLEDGSSKNIYIENDFPTININSSYMSITCAGNDVSLFAIQPTAKMIIKEIL